MGLFYITLHYISWDRFTLHYIDGIVLHYISCGRFTLH